MRKLLDEKGVFLCKMSNVRKESNKFFSKAENGSGGFRERAAGHSGSPGASIVQKRRDRRDDKGSIDSNRPICQNLKVSRNRDYNPNGVWHQQQMLPTHPLSYRFDSASCFVLNPQCFSRSLSESAVPCQQLSSLYFNSWNRDGAQRNTTNKALSSEALNNCLRSWQFTKLGKTLKKMNMGRNAGITFKLMSYNVLAQDLLVAHPYLYKENNPMMLKWHVRWRNIYNDIKKHNCEIICLQEVQQDHLKEYYDTLSELGYKGIYKQRTGIRSDGCAIYYKSNTFKLIEYATVEYLQPNVNILDRDNVGIIATFAPIANLSAEFIVATTHLLYNPRRHDIRLAQTQLLLAEIERMAYRHNKAGLKYVPILLTGDLNSEPQTPVHDFIARGKLKYVNMELRANYVTGKSLIPSSLMITDNCQHANLLKFRSVNRTLTRQDEEKHVQIVASDRREPVLTGSVEHIQYNFNSGTLTHNFFFKSVYKHRVNSDNEGTTYQNAWVTVDYIFYTGILDECKEVKDGNLKLISRYSLPTSRQLDKVRIPNKEEGSDHLALVAYFKLEY